MMPCLRMIVPVAVLLLLLLLGGCESSEREAQAVATVAALQTENARLAAQVGGTPMPPATQQSSSESPIAAPEVELAHGSTFPSLLRRISLVPSSEQILDFVVHEEMERYYVSTAKTGIFVIDGSSLEIVQTVPISGVLTLDDAGNRLYVTQPQLYLPAGQQPVVTILDTNTLQSVDTLPDARYVAVDPAGGRVFTGSPVSLGMDENAPGVRVYDAETLELLGEIPQQGIPVFNPLRNELLIVGYSIYTADLATLTIQQDLLPELSNQTLPWCNGCDIAENAYVFEDAGIVVLTIHRLATGGGAGFYPRPRFLDATTLEPLTDFTQIPELVEGCGMHPWLQGPVADRIYRQSFYARYVFYRNLDVFDLNGSPLAWRDGLYFQVLLENSNQGITENGRVIDLASLTPLGRVPEMCVLAHDENRIYGATGGDLLVLGVDGGNPLGEIPTEPDVLPAMPVSEILVSPNYGADNTIFLNMGEQRLYRSQDGGSTWSRVQGGLPSGDSVTIHVALSPDYANDNTLFAGGYAGDSRGEGVWKSTDHGTTWQPMWAGLSMLRVNKVTVSPTFAQDGMVHAQTRYTRIDPWESGAALFVWSAQEPVWTLVATATTESTLPQPADLYPSLAAQPQPVRITDYGRSIEYSADEGVTWQAVSLEKAEDHYLREVVLSPWYADDRTVYVLGEYEIWRSSDGGATWQAWADDRLAGRDYSRALTAIAVSPRLADGDYRIFVGTWAGEFWVLSPADFVDPVQAAPVAAPPDIAAGEESSLLPTPTPDGAVDYKGEPPAGLYKPAGTYNQIWAADPALQEMLGWAETELPAELFSALQFFENGTMIWRSDADFVYVLYNDGTWEAFDDTFEEGEPESDPTLAPPPNRLQPIRGFGKVWRENEEVRNRLGWALSKESGITASVHHFERGFMISFGGIAYALASGPEGNIWQ